MCSTRQSWPRPGQPSVAPPTPSSATCVPTCRASRCLMRCGRWRPHDRRWVSRGAETRLKGRSGLEGRDVATRVLRLLQRSLSGRATQCQVPSTRVSCCPEATSWGRSSKGWDSQTWSHRPALTSATCGSSGPRRAWVSHWHPAWHPACPAWWFKGRRWTSLCVRRGHVLRARRCTWCAQHGRGEASSGRRWLSRHWKDLSQRASLIMCGCVSVLLSGGTRECRASTESGVLYK